MKNNTFHLCSRTRMPFQISGLEMGTLLSGIWVRFTSKLKWKVEKQQNSETANQQISNNKNSKTDGCWLTVQLEENNWQSEQTVNWSSNISNISAISAIYQQYIGLLSKSSWWQRDQIRAGSCWGWWGSGRRGCRGRRACSRWAPCLSPVGADPNFVQQSILTPFHNSLYTDV